VHLLVLFTKNTISNAVRIATYQISYNIKILILIPLYSSISGFGGLEVACSPLVSEFAGSNPAESVGFFGRKNPQYAFLWRGSKAVCPMWCLTACKKNSKVTWKSPLSAKFLGHFWPTFPPSAAGFASVASDAGCLLWRKLERSKSLVLLQVVWQRHSVKPSC
jgi:hypothetical protein